MKTFIIAIFLFSSIAFANPIKIGIIDTGLNNPENFQLCEGLSKSYVLNETFNNDNQDHGTKVASLIRDNILTKDYCIVMYKVFSKNQANNLDLPAIIKAMQDATNDKIDVLNLSFSGNAFSVLENLAIKRLLDNGTTVVGVSGNEGFKLDKCSVYPACHDKRIIVVGGYNSNGDVFQKGTRIPASSNFVMSQAETCELIKKEKICRFGTSFAAPLVTALMANIIINRDKAKNE